MTPENALEAVIEAADTIARRCDSEAYWRSGCEAAPYYALEEMFKGFADKVRELIAEQPARI